MVACLHLAPALLSGRLEMAASQGRGPKGHPAEEMQGGFLTLRSRVARYTYLTDAHPYG